MLLFKLPMPSEPVPAGLVPAGLRLVPAGLAPAGSLLVSAGPAPEAAARPGTPGSPGRVGEVVARLSPVTLPVSAQVRLGRLHPRAIWKEDARQLIVPLAEGDDLADRLVGVLSELFPEAQAA